MTSQKSQPVNPIEAKEAKEVKIAAEEVRTSREESKSIGVMESLYLLSAWCHNEDDLKLLKAVTYQ